MPKPLVDLIKSKNELSKTIHSNYEEACPDTRRADEVRLIGLKQEISNSLAKIRLTKRQKLRSKLLKADPNRKKFWRFLKSQVKCAGSITAAYDGEGKMVFSQDEIEEQVMLHFSNIFSGQRIPVFENPVEQSEIELAINEIDDILNAFTLQFEPSAFEEEVCAEYTFSELQSEIESLSNCKAAGIDAVPNELLKNSGCQFQMYLHVFLNKIMREGHVPPDLNTGKCLLVHKGGDSMMTSQYRLITVPSNLLRLITARMCRRMTAIAERHGMIGPEQFGFRAGKSTTDAVFVLTTLIQKAKIKR